MTDLEKAARMALETLEQLQGGCTDSNDGTVEAITVWCPEVITALRQALEQPAQQKPVGQLMEETYGRGQVLWFNKPDDLSMLYTSPQRKPWVGLTDAQIGAVAADIWGSVLIAPQSCQAFARAIEAKLKEKNK